MCSFRRLADSIYFEAAPANRSEEHTSELQSQSNLVCRLIISEEHTSELQSQSNLVCRLLLEKKKITDSHEHTKTQCIHHMNAIHDHQATLVRVCVSS